MSARDDLLTMDDEALLQACSQETCRGSGAGGQHRNTTDTAVRLTLPEHGISVSSCISRSQHRNRRDALKKLRLAIAMELRQAAAPEWSGPLDVGRRDRRYPLFVAAIFDALERHHYQVGDAARELGLSTGRLVRLLAGDTTLWAAVNQARQKRGYRPLRQP